MSYEIRGVSVLRLPSVMKRVGLKKSSIYAGIKKGTFPAPIKLSERASGWLESSIDAFLAERIKASCGGVSA
ncbi:helix-turn-helix transcriptional regulator [Pseudoduganella sp. RAF53_2]|uniref:helix-turn-helix transcriptional regulator n=1 Tax=unclassified Pseudoduganella TaxID=2637179 RepID=UPI003F9A9F46